MRRDLWTGGLLGLVGGAAAGAAAFAFTRQVVKPKWLNKNHSLLFVLGGAAATSFVGVNVAATGKMQGLGDVFERHALERALKNATATAASAAAGNAAVGTTSSLTASSTTTSAQQQQHYRVKHFAAMKAEEEKEKEESRRLLAALEAKEKKQLQLAAQPLKLKPEEGGGAIRYDDDLTRPLPLTPTSSS